LSTQSHPTAAAEATGR